MANILKWLFLTLATSFVSALVFMLLGKVEKLNQLQKDLEDARIDLEVDRAKATYTKARDNYEQAVKDYRNTLLNNADFYIITPGSLSGSVAASSSATLPRTTATPILH